MNLRIIKKGSAKTAAIHPFFFSDGQPEGQPEPYILPEAAQAEVLHPVPELSEVIEDSEPPIDIEQLEKDAFERGYAEGRSAGLAEGLKTGEETAAAQIDEMARIYTDSLAEIAVLKDTLRDQVEAEVVRLSLAVAKKIVHREIQIDPTIIHTLVRVALERVAGKSAVVIRLSPADYQYMTRRYEDISQTEGREIKFEPDSTITRGSCIIQTDTGDVDARIEEEFREVESAFFERL